MSRITLLLAGFLLATTQFSCAPKAVQIEKPALVREDVKVPAGLSLESTWEKILQDSKKEEKVVIYGAQTIGLAIRQSSNIFKHKVGLDIDVVSGSGSEMNNKLLRERANGLFIPDIYLGGLNTVFSIKPAGIADPLEAALILQEVIDPKLWREGKLPWADKDRLIFTFWAYVSHMITTNTQLMKTEEIKSYYDILDPRWRNKIILTDPTSAGPGFNGFSTLLVNKIVDLDFFRQLVSQEPAVSRDERLVVDWLARGKYSLGFWASSGPASEYLQAGAPLKYAEPKEGTYVSSSGGNMMLVKKAPHPNAARIFMNWLLSREGQVVLQNSVKLQSARQDVSPEGLDPLTVRKPTGKYFIGANNIEEWVIKEQDKYLELAKQVFKPVLQ